MPALPPLQLICETAFQTVLVPLAVAAAVSFAVVRFSSRRGEVAGGAIALAAAFLAANHFRGAVEFRLDNERPLAAAELIRAAWRVVIATSDSAIALPPAYYWLPWIAFLGTLAEIVASQRRVGCVPGWLIRTAAAAVASRLLVPPATREEFFWLWPALAATIVANWFVLEDAFRDSSAGWPTLGLAGVFLSGSVVLIHAHTARFSDIAMILAGGCVGIAVIAAWRRCKPAGTTPIAAIVLPGLMLVAQQSTFSDVPVAGFALIGMAPLAIFPLIFVRSASRGGWKFAIAGSILLLIPASIAVILAVRAETLAFD